MAENGYDKFLTETSGMGPVPNAQTGRTRGRSGWKARAKKAGRATKSHKTGVPARNKPNKYVAPRVQSRP